MRDDGYSASGPVRAPGRFVPARDALAAVRSFAGLRRVAPGSDEDEIEPDLVPLQAGHLLFPLRVVTPHIRVATGSDEDDVSASRHDGPGLRASPSATGDGRLAVYRGGAELYEYRLTVGHDGQCTWRRDPVADPRRGQHRTVAA